MSRVDSQIELSRLEVKIIFTSPRAQKIENKTPPFTLIIMLFLPLVRQFSYALVADVCPSSLSRINNQCFAVSTC